MQIIIKNQQLDCPLSASQTKKIVLEFLTLEKISCEEVSVTFVNSKKISKLHKLYFGDPSVTDCISFPIDEDFLGDIFVCPATALNYVEKHGGELYEEITLYVIHGLLHLIGYDDIDPKDKKIMRRAEMRHIKNLKEKNLILTSANRTKL